MGDLYCYLDSFGLTVCPGFEISISEISDHTVDKTESEFVFFFVL